MIFGTLFLEIKNLRFQEPNAAAVVLKNTGGGWCCGVAGRATVCNASIL